MKMQDGTYFDGTYFGHKPGERKSNYSAIGGYKHETGAPDQFAAWVLENLKRAIPGLKIVPPAGSGKGLVKGSPKVLEIGCATGLSVLKMRERGIRAYGMDISPYILEQALPAAKPFLFLGDMTDLAASGAVKHKPFSAIVSKDVLEHATPDKIESILRQFGEWATVQFHVVNTGEYEYQAFDGDKTHFIRWTLAEWEERAREWGLNIVFKPT